VLKCTVVKNIAILFLFKKIYTYTIFFDFIIQAEV